MKNKKKSVITLIAVLTAIIGAAVAVGAFLKRKARDISDKLDYDGSLYYEDDDFDDFSLADSDGVQESVALSEDESPSTIANPVNEDFSGEDRAEEE